MNEEEGEEEVSGRKRTAQGGESNEGQRSIPDQFVFREQKDIQVPTCLVSPLATECRRTKAFGK